MTNDRKKIADKIQKLLAKAESTGHAPEADAFRKKAEELMQKHSLTLAQLEEAEFTAHNWTPGYKSAPGWYKSLVAGVGSFLGVFTGYDSTSKGEPCVFILGGREQDIELLKYIAQSIKAQVQQLTRDFKERTDASRADTNGYRLGVVQRIGERLQDMVKDVSDWQAEQALVLADENREKKRKGEQAIRREQGVVFRGSTRAHYQSESARRKGHKDGDQVNVHKGAPGGSTDPDRQITS